MFNIYFIHLKYVSSGVVTHWMSKLCDKYHVHLQIEASHAQRSFNSCHNWFKISGFWLTSYTPNAKYKRQLYSKSFQMLGPV